MNNPLKQFKGYTEGPDFKFITDKEEDRFKKYLASIKYKTKKRTPIKLIVERYRPGRTSKQANEKSNQNGYLWGVVIESLIHSEPFVGHTQDDMNYGLKCMFLRIGGSDAFPKTESFADLSAKKFEEKMKEIQVWALTDYGITIETVEEYYHGNLTEE